MDISTEEYREVVYMLNGSAYKINSPVRFVDVGNIHQVVDAEGVVHSYPSPSTGLVAVRWKLRKEVEDAE